MSFFVYRITNQINGKIYVGKTNNLEKRWRAHILIAAGGREKYSTFRAIHAAISKYGSDNFEFHKLSEYELESEALQEEMRMIALLRSGGTVLYNLTDGGEGVSGHKHSPESIKKMSDAKLGTHHGPHTKETREKIGIKHRGENNFWAKCTEKDVALILSLRGDGYSYGLISEIVEVPGSTIAKICSGQSWKHVPRQIQGRATHSLREQKVNATDVLEMRAKDRAGVSQLELSKQYPMISRRSIYDIVRRISWRHI